MQDVQRPAHTGRKCKLTDEPVRRILDVLATGGTHRTACRVAGISTSTFYSWLERGEREPSGPFPEFLDAVRQVEAQREVEALATISKAAGEDWRAAAWYLSRRYPNRWGNGKRGIVVENSEPPFPDTMLMSKEAVALAETLERICLVKKPPHVKSAT